ncbi:uncharacterized protein LOC132724687 [Ruditapes philippinarum]|uniref:uncharacterized protein LOC132724687 n=1 Tax=Ruditapes philippinarum TaxID=129788 RepID=UPI00295B55F3|nr:uncharacterized protein LOC132724687 [Ruditapes philippinarum]
MDETQLITDENHVTTVPEVTDNGQNETGKKKRKRKYSQKQWERWMKYREKKGLEKKMNVRNMQEVTMAIDGTHQHITLPVVSNLRAEAEEFVPRSFTLTYDKQLSQPNDNAQIQENDVETQANSGETEIDEETQANTAEDSGAESSFGILSIYAASELHSSIDKDAYCAAKDAEMDFGYTFFSIWNL